MRKDLNLRTNIALGLIFAFLANTFGPIPTAKAQLAWPAGGEFVLSKPGAMVFRSPAFNPPILKGIKVHPKNPFRFDFILDQGDSVIARNGVTKQSQEEQLKIESTKLIKYFLASLTIPEKDLWVNLSPYEKDRIIPQSFGLTEMGRDLLAEDYMLKQITASLIYPEGEVGRIFWKKIYEESAKRFGTTNIPVNTFNKIWIVPEKAVVYENAEAGTAYVVESKLKVMLEQDYLALEKNSVIARSGATKQSFNGINSLGSQIVREIVIPELTKEVNENKNFAQLRQVYNSLILATWYKKKIRDSILEQVYADKNKIAGVDYVNSLSLVGRVREGGDIEIIYQRYLQAFKKGVYNYIKEEQDPLTRQTIPRKYFSGGFNLMLDNSEFTVSHSFNKAMLSKLPKLAFRLVSVSLISAALYSSAFTRNITANNRQHTTIKDKAMQVEKSQIITLRQAQSARNNDVINMLTTDWFQQVTGLDLRHGTHKIVNIGAGMYPFDSLAIQDAMERMRHPDSTIEVYDTELSNSKPKYHIRFPFFKGREFKIRISEEVNAMPAVTPQNIKDVYLVANNRRDITELDVEYVSNSQRLFNIAGINPSFGLMHRGDLWNEFRNNGAYDHMITELNRQGIGINNIKEMLEGKIPVPPGVEIEEHPLERILRPRGIELVEMDNEQEARKLTGASIITMHNVFMHVPGDEEMAFLRRIGSLLRPNGVLEIRDSSAEGRSIEIWQDVQGFLVSKGRVSEGFGQPAIAEGILEKVGTKKERDDLEVQFENFLNAVLLDRLSPGQRRILENADTKSTIYFIFDTLQPKQIKIREATIYLSHKLGMHVPEMQVERTNPAMTTIHIVDDVDILGDRKSLEDQVKAIAVAVQTNNHHPIYDFHLMQDSLNGARPNLKYALAVDPQDNKIIGYAFFEIRQNKEIYVSNLDVLPAFQRSSIGFQLMERVFKFEDSVGSQKVSAATSSGFDNPALNFYGNFANRIKGHTVKVERFPDFTFFDFIKDQAMLNVYETTAEIASAVNDLLASPEQKIWNYQENDREKDIDALKELAEGNLVPTGMIKPVIDIFLNGINDAIVGVSSAQGLKAFAEQGVISRKDISSSIIIQLVNDFKQPSEGHNSLRNREVVNILYEAKLITPEDMSNQGVSYKPEVKTSPATHAFVRKGVEENLDGMIENWKTGLQNDESFDRLTTANQLRNFMRIGHVTAGLLNLEDAAKVIKGLRSQDRVIIRNSAETLKILVTSGLLRREKVLLNNIEGSFEDIDHLDIPREDKIYLAKTYYSLPGKSSLSIGLKDKLNFLFEILNDDELNHENLSKMVHMAENKDMTIMNTWFLKWTSLSGVLSNTKLKQISLRDEGFARTDFADFLKEAVEFVNLSLPPRPEGMPVKQNTRLPKIGTYGRYINVGDVLIDTLKPDKQFGRTLVYYFPQSKKAIYLKLLKKNESNDNLIYEHDLMNFFNSKKDEWGLRGKYPRGIIPIGKVPADQVSFNEKDIKLNKDDTGNYTFMAYETDLGENRQDDYMTYLNDPDLNHEEFMKAFEVNTHDRMVMARHGLFDLEIIELFHNREGSRGRQYDLMVDIRPFQQERHGAGRLEDVTGATLYPNLRLSGPADLPEIYYIGDILEDREVHDRADSRIRRIMDVAGWKNDIGVPYLMAALLGDTMLSLGLMAPTYLLRRGELSYDHEASQENSFLHQTYRTLFKESYKIYTRKNVPGIDSQLDLQTKLISMQAGYYMTDRYVRDFYQNINSSAILFPGSHVGRIIAGRGWVDQEGWDLKGVPYKIPSRNPNINLVMPSFDLGPVNGPNPWQAFVRSMFILTPAMEIGNLDTPADRQSTDQAMMTRRNSFKSNLGIPALNKGGIDFTTGKTPLEIKNAGEGIKFNMDPAMLRQLQNVPGFVPVIINIQPMNDLKEFLGLDESIH